jgi:hypothetical protein
VTDIERINKVINYLRTNSKQFAESIGLDRPDRIYQILHGKNDCNISKDDISLCLGHSDPSRRITDIYLNEDFSIIDNANRKVLNLLKEKSPTVSQGLN